MEIKRSGTYFSILLLFFLICCFTACNDENNMEGMIIPSVEELSLSGEGESALISFTNSNWQIAAISTLDKSVQIWGDIYDLNGKLIHSNTILTLDGLGKLESSWSDYGFVITRDNLQTLKVEVLENSSEKDFGFIITLKSEMEVKEITVGQNKSEGYVFKRIEYTLISESHKMVWYENGHFTFSNQTGQESELVKYNPFQNQYENLTFDSVDPRAFSWVKGEAIQVEVPGGILHGNLFYNNETIPYRNSTTQLPLVFSVGEVPIKVPAGDSKCHFELEYEEFKAAYRIFVKNRKTEMERIFEGTLISSRPTATHRLVWSTENKPEE